VTTPPQPPPPPPPPPGPPGYPPPPPPNPYEPPPPPAYPYQGTPQYPQAEQGPVKTSGWAIASLIFGIIGGFVLSVIFGIIALNKTKDGKQGGRNLAVIGLLLSAVWALIAGFAIFNAVTGRHTVDATDVAMGDCFTEIPDSSRVYSLNKVSCDKPHKGEVYAVLTMPGGDYPGQSAIDEFKHKCGPELESYAPAAMEDPSIGVYVLYPTPETWVTGDHVVTCIATADPPRSGSVKG
jgi:hypothetical protein